MKMGIENAAGFGIWNMDSEVHHHAPGDKVFQQKTPCQSDVLIQREFVLQGNVETVCKLSISATFGFFYCIPEGMTVSIFSGCVVGQ